MKRNKIIERIRKKRNGINKIRIKVNMYTIYGEGVGYNWVFCIT